MTKEPEDRSDDRAERGDQGGQGADAPPSRGYRIPGRDFGGTSFASDEREQTADHRGESRDYVVDDVQADPGERRDVPRDES
jgi:hypothetical protein